MFNYCQAQVQVHPTFQGQARLGQIEKTWAWSNPKIWSALPQPFQRPASSVNHYCMTVSAIDLWGIQGGL